jgi:hypothetical protein
MTKPEKLKALKRDFATSEKLLSKLMANYASSKVIFESHKKKHNQLAGKISDLEFEIKHPEK